MSVEDKYFENVEQLEYHEDEIFYRDNAMIMFTYRFLKFIFIKESDRFVPVVYDVNKSFMKLV